MQLLQLIPCVLFAVGAATSIPAQSKLEPRLLAALHADTADVRGEAACLLGLLGDARHVDAIGALLDDEAVRSRAIQALANLADRDARSKDAVAKYLLQALNSGVVYQRADAALALGTCAGCGIEDWSGLTGRLADPSATVRLAAACSLLKLQVPFDTRDVEDLLRSNAGGEGDGYLSALLPLLRDPKQRPLLTPLLKSENPMARDLAEQAAARLDALAKGASPSWRTPEAEKRDLYAATNATAEAALRQMQWHPVLRKALLDAVHRSRFVVFGESHFSAGPLRDAQCEMLRAFVGEHPERDAIGFEPSVEKAQQRVIAAGQELGMTVLPLEQHWQTLNPQRRLAERDDEAAAVINQWLADPSHRMFVIRGQSHVLPDGYLLQRLNAKPVIVLSVSGCGPSLEQLGDEISSVGRTWRLGDEGSIYFCGVDEFSWGPQAAKLRAWLKQH